MDDETRRAAKLEAVRAYLTEHFPQQSLREESSPLWNHHRFIIGPSSKARYLGLSQDLLADEHPSTEELIARLDELHVVQVLDQTAGQSTLVLVTHGPMLIKRAI